jgi:hypothetical protein
MAGIEISGGIPEPTICGPVSQFQDLTLSSNAISMGAYGAIAGFLAFLCFWFAYTWVAPRVHEHGRRRGWWS